MSIESFVFITLILAAMLSVNMPSFAQLAGGNGALGPVSSGGSRGRSNLALVNSDAIIGCMSGDGCTWTDAIDIANVNINDRRRCGCLRCGRCARLEGLSYSIDGTLIVDAWAINASSVTVGNDTQSAEAPGKS